MTGVMSVVNAGDLVSFTEEDLAQGQRERATGCDPKDLERLQV